MVKIRVLQENAVYKVGDIIDCLKGDVAENINSGFAELVEAKKEIENPLAQLNVLSEYKIVLEFRKHNPFFYDSAGIFWMWDKEYYKYSMCDEIDLRVSLESLFNMKGMTVENKVKNVYIESFKTIGREFTPKDTPVEWIQFKDKVYDIKENKTFQASSDYFFTNPIPWTIGTSDKTPIMDRLFADWVGEDKKNILYQILAYCLYRDYPLHFIFCFLGVGSNGKSKYLKILTNFLGFNNCSSTELDLLATNRFENVKLHKKLACMMGETNAGNISQTSMLKKLTGQDMVSIERKNKTAFDDINYAKILVATNGLPVSTDISQGFYRRWIIIDFPNKFSDTEGDILRIIPQDEYNNLAKKCLKLLPELLNKNAFEGQESIDERSKRYQMASNPLPEFIRLHCIEDYSPEGMVFYKTFYMAYIEYLKRINKRAISKVEFSRLLNAEGYDNMKTTFNNKNGNWIIGLRLKTYDNLVDYSDYAEEDKTMKNRVLGEEENIHIKR